VTAVRRTAGAPGVADRRTEVGLAPLTERRPYSGDRQQPLRCRPPPCASNFSFLHLSVIEEEPAYDSKGSTSVFRDLGKQSFDLYHG
jgi:hypothetical protein